MRLGQFARKYDLSPQEIISFLDDAVIDNAFHHANARLDDPTKLLLAQHFNLSLEEAHDVSDAEVIEIPVDDPDDERLLDEVSNEELSENTIVVAPIIDTEENQTNEKEEQQQEAISHSDDSSASVSENKGSTIETDKLLALLEDENAQIDLSSITHIKAPKRELGGLKVVGKIDLPDPRVKKESEKNEQEEAQGNLRKSNGKFPKTPLSEEERERRRLQEKRKREKHEQRLEEQRKEKERKALKALKEAHYREKLERKKSKQPQHLKQFDQKGSDSQHKEQQQTQPKTLLGKFWRWLNT